jgi:hypothetical protein
MVPIQESRIPALDTPGRSGGYAVPEDLAGRLERSIERIAAGRIRELRVVCLENAIILEGWSRTYHAKQLAQEAVLGVTQGQFSLANHIVVC